MPTATALQPFLAARVTGIDTGQGLSASDTAWLRELDFGWSRARVDPTLVTEAERTAHPPVRRAMVAAENPHGPAVYPGAHGPGSVEGCRNPRAAL